MPNYCHVFLPKTHVSSTYIASIDETTLKLLLVVLVLESKANKCHLKVHHFYWPASEIYINFGEYCQ